MSGFRLKRLGIVMEPEPGNPMEVDGVLNPASARGPDGQLYLFSSTGRAWQLLPHRRRAVSRLADPARLADGVSRCQRTSSVTQLSPCAAILGRRAGAFGSVSARHPPSLTRACADAGVAACSARRDELEPLERRLRGDGPDLHRGNHCPRRPRGA